MKILLSSIIANNKPDNTITKKNTDNKQDNKQDNNEQDNNEQDKLDGIFNHRVFEYAADNHIKISSSLDSAIDHRSRGFLFLSLREVDILARGNVNLKENSFLRNLIIEYDYMFCEDIPYLSVSVWVNRLRYNKGLLWLKSNIDKKDTNIYKKGLEIKEELIEYFNKKNLPLWPEELDSGFHEEFLFPEFIGSDEYYKATKRGVLVN